MTTRSLQLECTRVLFEALLVLVLFHESEAMVWREKELSKIRVVHMNNRDLLGIRRTNRTPISRTGELCVVTKGMDEMTDKTVLRWLGHSQKNR